MPNEFNEQRQLIVSSTINNSDSFAKNYKREGNTSNMNINK